VSWEPRALPAQPGKTFVVTGANAGLGYFTSEQLAATGAHVVLACRSPARTDAALAAIRGRVPGASVSALRLDVADLASVESAAAILRGLPRIDALVLNAGIVHPPRDRKVSADGHELVLATNYLGHFTLAALVLPVLFGVPGSRVVALGSIISRLMDSSLEDLELQTTYSPWQAYAQSKVAAQVFGFELDRRLRAAGAATRSLVVQPGYSISGLSPRIPGVNEPSMRKRVMDRLQVFAQGKDHGAWSIVRSVVDPGAEGGQYYGPRLLTRGHPVLQTPTRTSRDPGVAARLWDRSEKLSGLSFPV
jgi:NAD(P)-dependent dehydrogenase (short-subunit alcohol dehydrogenase family)